MYFSVCCVKALVFSRGVLSEGETGENRLLASLPPLSSEVTWPCFPYSHWPSHIVPPLQCNYRVYDWVRGRDEYVQDEMKRFALILPEEFSGFDKQKQTNKKNVHSTNVFLTSLLKPLPPPGSRAVKWALLLCKPCMRAFSLPCPFFVPLCVLGRLPFSPQKLCLALSIHLSVCLFIVLF